MISACHLCAEIWATLPSCRLSSIPHRCIFPRKQTRRHARIRQTNHDRLPLVCAGHRDGQTKTTKSRHASNYIASTGAQHAARPLPRHLTHTHARATPLCHHIAVDRLPVVRCPSMARRLPPTRPQWSAGGHLGVEETSLQRLEEIRPLGQMSRASTVAQPAVSTPKRCKRNWRVMPMFTR